MVSSSQPYTTNHMCTHVSQSFCPFINSASHEHFHFAKPGLVQSITQKRYKASFRWVTEEDKATFKNSTVIVPISVGQKYHEAGEFEATIALINKSFKECHILIADTLRRHSPEVREQVCNNDLEASRLTIRRGEQWFYNNEKCIRMLSIPYRISKWNEWLSHPSYTCYYNAVLKLYKEDSSYRAIVDNDIAAFLCRGNRKDDPESINNCRSYILEESAVVCLWVLSGFELDVYPMGDNKAMITAYERLMKVQGYKYRSLSLNINKRGS